MSTITIFRSIQIGFVILMMVAIGYCNRIRAVQDTGKTALRETYFEPKADTTFLKKDQ